MRQIKIFLVASAALIAAGSLVVSHILIGDLSEEERKRMEIWAQALHALNLADETTDLSLVLDVLQGNTTIPVIVTDETWAVTDFRNVSLSASTYSDSLSELSAQARRMHQAGRFLEIELAEGYSQLVCYDESLMLRRLATYPYIELAVVLVFSLVALLALLVSKRAEQNRVWVGLSKETAHQLGTPITSLMGWTAVLRDTYPADPLLPEMEKDVRRLQLIADRFSKIGSRPEPVLSSLREVMGRVADYMDRRTPGSVRIETRLAGEGDTRVRMCQQLFEWVLENLLKNAVDAMAGSGGTITLTAWETEALAIIDVADTGRGIRKRDLGNVFRPGFTTKQRGWGLGLSLARRIVEDYHHGRIYVKSSEVGRGTTFRIELPK